MGKPYRMFLDDLREPPVNWRDAVIARSVEQARQFIDSRGMPIAISFDHDLGSDMPTGYDFAKALVETDLDCSGSFIPKGFRFHVHSANPVGAKNIQSLLDSYLAQRESA